MFFKRANAAEFVKAGSAFRRTRPDRMIETARILSVAADGFGIPHVKYELTVEKPSALPRMVEGHRMLSLSAFTNTYSERVAG